MPNTIQCANSSIAIRANHIAITKILVLIIFKLTRLMSDTVNDNHVISHVFTCSSVALFATNETRVVIYELPSATESIPGCHGRHGNAICTCSADGRSIEEKEKKLDSPPVLRCPPYGLWFLRMWRTKRLHNQMRTLIIMNAHISGFTVDVCVKWALT
jgi:hypothetical protein